MWQKRVKSTPALTHLIWLWCKKNVMRELKIGATHRNVSFTSLCKWEDLVDVYSISVQLLISLEGPPRFTKTHHVFLADEIVVCVVFFVHFNQHGECNVLFQITIFRDKGI